MINVVNVVNVVNKVESNFTFARRSSKNTWNDQPFLGKITFEIH